ncbi:MAG: 2-oxo acid dehydrogenase subunit E2 [Rhodobacteraceae bacterium]|nr:2-oxo acid dehydrogenase subunit E2 [Paracoccaceae bacterium]
MVRMIEVRVPDIGDFSEVPVLEVAVDVGDAVQIDDPVIMLESDKATLDVPTPHAGSVFEVKVKEGDRVSQGDVIMTLKADADEAAADDAYPAARTPMQQASRTENTSRPAPRSTAPMKTPAPPARPGLPVYASPSVRKFARTLGADISEVTGSGPKGRILREDVEAHIKARLSAAQAGAMPAPGEAALLDLPDWPRVDFAKFGPVERTPLSRIARITGPALSRNAIVIPHVTSFDKADVTDLEAFRRTLNDERGSDEAKLTMLAFAVKVVVAALKAYPKFNASLDGEDLVLKQYWNIGVAADTPDGLVVPVIKQADKKGLRDIAAEIAEFAAVARGGKLPAADMQGATFTISSLGGVGGTGFTPIINAPEVAILGMTRAEVQPVWDGTDFAPRLIQPASLSWDHRVIDGVLAARFLVHVTRTLGDFRRIAV